MTLKVAIVGCGKIADGHVEEIQKMPAAARVVAVADRELLMAEQLAKRYGIPAFYDDFDRLLVAERPDVVHVTTPPQSHVALAESAMEAGAHVYVEKPLTPSYAESKRLVDRARGAGKKLTIGYSYFFDPPLVALRELCARGVLGDPVHVESFMGYSLSGAFGTALLADPGHWVHRLPGRLFHNNLDHVLYALLEFLPDRRADDEVETDPLGDLRIAAQGWSRRARRFGDARDATLDELRVVFTGPGASALAWFSCHVRPATHFVHVYGTNNSAQVNHLARTLTLEAQSRLPSALGRLVPAFDQGAQFFREGARNVVAFARNEFHYFTGMNRLFSLFYESIANDGPPPIAYRDILRIAAWMDEIWRQVPQQGTPS